MSNATPVERPSEGPTPVAPPALRNLVPSHLPLPPTPLLGRERELTDVAGMLRNPSVRILTPTGPGGVGKTRLAIQLAVDLAADYADGAPFVDLAPIRDPDLVIPSVVQGLGVHGVPGRPLRESLAEAMGGRRPLLVLDNLGR